jgi:hypothetical protein
MKSRPSPTRRLPKDPRYIRYPMATRSTLAAPSPHANYVSRHQSPTFRLALVPAPVYSPCLVTSLTLSSLSCIRLLSFFDSCVLVDVDIGVLAVVVFVVHSRGSLSRSSLYEAVEKQNKIDGIDVRVAHHTGTTRPQRPPKTNRPSTTVAMTLVRSISPNGCESSMMFLSSTTKSAFFPISRVPTSPSEKEA